MPTTANLALLHDPGLFGPGDYQLISEKIREKAPDINVYIYPDFPGITRVSLPASLSEHPLLTFCPTHLEYFRPPRGRVFCGQRIRKDEQLRLLAKGGVRVPQWTYLKPGLQLRTAEWGDQVIVKPIDFGKASLGRGVELVNTDAVGTLLLTYQMSNVTTKNFVVQKFINSGSYSSDYRVLTLFGRTLYAIKRVSGVPLTMPTAEHPRVVKGVVSNVSAGEPHTSTFCYEEDVLKFAGNCYGAIPNVPLQAVDIRREHESGRLFCLEINPGGLTWNFSSKRAQTKPLIDGMRREDQFGAWSIAADALIENVRLFAS